MAFDRVAQVCYNALQSAQHSGFVRFPPAARLVGNTQHVSALEAQSGGSHHPWAALFCLQFLLERN